LTKRKFYRQVFTVVVVGEEPLEWDSLHDIAREIFDGDFVGRTRQSSYKEIDGKTAADALYALGSEPGFFGLDDYGCHDDGTDTE